MSDTKQDEAKRYRQHPIWKTDFNIPMPRLIENIRHELTEARGHLTDLMWGYPAYRESLEHIEGLLTCGLVTLAVEKKRVQENEIRWADEKRGKSLQFNSRGLGSDVCPGCFVCGSEWEKDIKGGGRNCLSNISAFVASKEDGMEIVGWFKQGARLDWRPFEPNWIQVKIGACEKHLPNLKRLDYVTTDVNHSRIRQCDIPEMMAFVEVPAVAKEA